MQELVTIIIAIYNVEKYINQCIESVIQQTYHNLEIILVDDGSSDKSGVICDKYAELDDRILVIHKKNGGLSDARNVGLDSCKGEYIAFLDGDDYVSEYFVEIFYSVATKEKCDLVMINKGTEFWDGEEEPDLIKQKTDYSVEYLSSKESLKKMLYQHIGTGAPFKFCHKSLYKDIRFPYGYLYEDVATTYKLFCKANKTGIIYTRTYGYRKRKDSIVRQKFSEKKMIAIKIANQLINDDQLNLLGLEKASKCRALSLLFSVYLQADINDNKNINLLWDEIKAIRNEVVFDKDPLVRKKAKYAAIISFLGKKAFWVIGRKIGQKNTMG